MEQKPTSRDQIIQAVAESPGCLLEDLVSACPDLTWNQVFLEVDRLSRTGEVHLTRAGAGKYCARLPSQTRESLGRAPSVGERSGGSRALHDRRK